MKKVIEYLDIAAKKIVYFFKIRPSVEEVIDSIVDLFSKEELEAFKIYCDDGEVFDLRRRMFLNYYKKRPFYKTIEESEEYIENAIENCRHRLVTGKINMNFFWLLFDNLFID